MVYLVAGILALVVGFGLSVVMTIIGFAGVVEMMARDEGEEP